jgi:hypothetical protein
MNRLCNFQWNLDVQLQIHNRNWDLNDVYNLKIRCKGVGIINLVKNTNHNNWQSSEKNNVQWFEPIIKKTIGLKI